MIPLKFGLWWSGSKLSYLRYMTFKTIRHFHPNALIQLFVSKRFKKDGYKWGNEKQDFENDDISCDYLDKLSDIGIDIIYINAFDNYTPNFQSDLFRWWWLKNNGGFYMDTDQIVLKSFDSLPLDNDFLYSGYSAVTCGYYTPVGVVPSSKESQIVNFIYKNITKYINNNNYNSAGPFMLRSVLQNSFTDKIENLPSRYFYPIPESPFIEVVYNGSFKIPNDSYALHWYGGSPLSQDFNKIYNRDFAIKSNDTISSFLREKNLL